jgi:putative tryptophan/tyrosine transport system substrate-binding protein
MQRRDFIILLGSAAVIWPLVARAQQRALPVIGFINLTSARNYTRRLEGFLNGLRETGYVDGRNVKIEYRWAEDRSDRLPTMAADLVQKQVAVIAATSTPAAVAAKAATTTIPIVFVLGSDPVQLGLVTSLNRPEGNVTGVTLTNIEMAPKRLQLLHELIPTARVIALLVNPTIPSLAEPATKELKAAARTLGLELHVLNATTEGDFDAVFAKLVQSGAGGLVIGPDPLFTSRMERLAELAVRNAVPAVFEGREFAAAGGLISYGGNAADAFHLAGVYTGRILKGDKPADLPVQQATTKVELVINLKTAKALGIDVPNALIGRANEVIE